MVRYHNRSFLSPEGRVGDVKRRKPVHDGHVQREVKCVSGGQPRYVQGHAAGTRQKQTRKDRK